MKLDQATVKREQDTSIRYNLRANQIEGIIQCFSQGPRVVHVLRVCLGITKRIFEGLISIACELHAVFFFLKYSLYTLWVNIYVCVQTAPTCGTHENVAESSDGESCSDSDSDRHDSSDEEDEGINRPRKIFTMDSILSHRRLLSFHYST